MTFGLLLIVFSTKVNQLFGIPEVLSSTSDKAKLFAGNFFKNSDLDEPNITLLAFPSKTNLKMYNIPVTPKLVKKELTNLDSSKVSRHDSITLVVLRKCESGLSYILAELLNTCLKESCLPNCWKVSSMVPIINKNGGERFTAKNYHPVNLLRLVKSLKNL